VPSGAGVDGIEPVRTTASWREVGLPERAPIARFCAFVQCDLGRAVRACTTVRGRLPDALLSVLGPRSRARRLRSERGVDAAIVEAGGTATRELDSTGVLPLPLGDRACNVGRGPIRLGDCVAAGRPNVTNPVGERASLFRDHWIDLACQREP
jgi:hypothetical protein